MDPDVAWKELIDAFQQLDWETVRELAEGLLQWMIRGGFPPETSAINIPGTHVGTDRHQSLGPGWNRTVALAACRYALDLANQVLNEPSGIPRRIPFTLACCNCDIQHGITYAEAIADRWIEIRFSPLSAAASFLGRCPRCQSFSDNCH